MSKDLILLVDDEADMLENCSRLLRGMGYASLAASNGEEALKALEEKAPSLVLSDLAMPCMGGIELLRHVKERWPEIPVILFTAFGSIESAVEAIRGGAFDYLPKPFTADQLRHSIDRALEIVRLARENRRLKEQLGDPVRFKNMIGAGKAMGKVMDIIRKISVTNSNILIRGESGTGKELAARSIHLGSHRAGHPFVPLDCAAIPESLMESELFGYEKGSFTGAHGDREGILESADKGTLFLDEVGELGMDLQVKLLRVLQERKVRRIGGRKEVDIDIRLISATNRDLEKAIGDRTFREDLYYRLNVISITLPPLRDRVEDIPALCEHFLRNLSGSEGLPVKSVSKAAMERLMAYPWPGNVRELQNYLERAACLCEGNVIGVEDFSDTISRKHGAEDFYQGLLSMDFKEAKKKYMAVFEKEYIENLLQRHGGNITRASEASGIPRMTIYRVLKKINRPPS